MGIYKPDGSYLMEKPAWLDLPSTEGRMDRLVTINWIPGFPIPLQIDGEARIAEVQQIVFEVGQYRNGTPKWRLLNEEMLRNFEALVAKNRHWDVGSPGTELEFAL